MVKMDFENLLLTMKSEPNADNCGAGCTTGSECPWKQEAASARQELEMFKEALSNEAKIQIARMESRVQVMVNETEVLKRTLESENRELTRRRVVLERENQALKQDIDDTRGNSNDSVSHLRKMRRELSLRCSDLEQMVEARDRQIIDLGVQLAENKIRNQFIERELGIATGKIERMHSSLGETKTKFSDTTRDMITSFEAHLQKLTTYYSNELKEAHESISKVSSELDILKMAEADLLEKSNNRETEFKDTACEIQRMVKTTLQETQESMDTYVQKLELDRDQALMNTKDREIDLCKAYKLMTELNAATEKHQRNTHRMCSEAIRDLMQQENWPESKLSKADSDSDLVEPTVDGHEHSVALKMLLEQGCEIIQHLKKEGASLKNFVKAVNDSKQGNEDQRRELRGRISELEESTNYDKMKYLKALEIFSVKRRTYKKLIVKLRNKPADDCINNNNIKTKELALFPLKSDGGESRAKGLPAETSSETNDSNENVYASCQNMKFNVYEFNKRMNRTVDVMTHIEEIKQEADVVCQRK